MIRNRYQILFHDAPRNADVLSISAIVEQQVVAQVLLAVEAVKANSAGRGVGGNHAHAGGEFLDARSHFHNLAGQFVSKQCRRSDHAGMIAASKDLQIGAAGKRYPNFDQNFSLAQLGYRNALDFHVFASMEDSSSHRAGPIGGHAVSHASPGLTTIFNESASGWAARLSASTACASGNR